MNNLKKYYKNILVAWMLLAPAVSYGQELNTDAVFYIYEDSTSAQLFRAISNSSFSSFQQLKSREISNAPTISTLWIKFKIKDIPGKSQYLELSSPSIAKINYWQPVVDNVFKEFKTGYLEPFKSRPIQIDRYVFPISEGEEWHYLNIKTDHYIFTQLNVKTLDEVMSAASSRSLLYNGYMILMFVGVAGVLFYVYLIRYYSYLFYIVYVFFISALNLMDKGYYFQLLWPDTPIINKYYTLLIYGASSFLLLFLTRIWVMRISIKIISLAMFATIATAFVYTVYLLMDDQFMRAAIVAQLQVYIISILVIIASMVSYKYATGIFKQSLKLINLGLLALAASTIIYVCSLRHVLPMNFFTENSLIFGSALEVCFLTTAIIIQSDEIYNTLKKGLASK